MSQNLIIFDSNKKDEQVPKNRNNGGHLCGSRLSIWSCNS